MTPEKKPQPTATAETARQEGAQGRARTADETVQDGQVDASDPVVAETAAIADQVHANA